MNVKPNIPGKGNEEIQQKLLSNMEELMNDTYTRMRLSCQQKCVPPVKYEQGEVVKTEAVCLDRCVAKFMAIHEQFGRRLAAKSEEQVKYLHTPIQLPETGDR